MMHAAAATSRPAGARILILHGMAHCHFCRVQARKPYTISKARERWSEEEHQRFVEAVRLHGRAWRKIEGELGYLRAERGKQALAWAGSGCSLHALHTFSS